LRLETGIPEGPAGAAKKPMDGTMVMQRGVSLTDLEQGAHSGFDAAGKGFAKKDNKANKIFLIVALIVGAVIVALLIFALAFVKGGNPP